MVNTQHQVKHRPAGKPSYGNRHCRSKHFNYGSQTGRGLRAPPAREAAARRLPAWARLWQLSDSFVHDGRRPSGHPSAEGSCEPDRVRFTVEIDMNHDSGAIAAVAKPVWLDPLMIEPCTHFRHRVDRPTTAHANFDNVLHRIPRCLGLEKRLIINPGAPEFLNLYADDRFLCCLTALVRRNGKACGPCRLCHAAQFRILPQLCHTVRLALLHCRGGLASKQELHPKCGCDSDNIGRKVSRLDNRD
jgi:hypothetical protein